MACHLLNPNLTYLSHLFLLSILRYFTSVRGYAALRYKYQFIPGIIAGRSVVSENVLVQYFVLFSSD